MTTQFEKNKHLDESKQKRIENNVEHCGQMNKEIVISKASEKF